MAPPRSPGDQERVASAALSDALAALERGESIVAVTDQKRPWFGWQRYQAERAAPDDLRAWADDRRCAGFATICGALSGIIVLDFDGDDGIALCERLGLEPHVRTPRGGYHVRFKHPGFKVRSTNSEVAKVLQRNWHGLDPRADGALAVEWGSNGNGDYEQLRDLAQLEKLEHLPERLLVDLGIRPGVPAPATEPDKTAKVRHPGRHAHLLRVAGAMRDRGAGEREIHAELRRVNERDCEPPKEAADVETLAKDVAERYDPAPAQKRLNELLGLEAVGMSVGVPRMFGSGANASVDIPLSNGETMTFQSIREMVRPNTLLAELVACSGATPALKQPQALQVVKLARGLAERVQVDSEDADSRQWGIEFVQAAETIDFRLHDQAERYAAFERLSQRDPWSRARELGCSFASGCIVLRDVSGAQLVRSEWFLRYVRGMSARETPTSLLTRMARVGWERRGSEGRIKARAAGRASAELVWAFWIVPAGWGDQL